MAKFLILALIVVGVTSYLFLSHSPQPKPNITIQPLSTAEPLPTLNPTSTPADKQIVTTAPLVPSGPPQGQISCNYQIPAGPGTYGTAEITATWANLTQAAVCVSVNGQSPSLMSQANSASGSRTITAPWIVLNGSYAFSLSAGSCAGTVLSTCRINTPQPAYTTPRPTKTP